MNACGECSTVVSAGAIQVQVMVDGVTYLLEPVPTPICKKCDKLVRGAVALFNTDEEAADYIEKRRQMYVKDSYHIEVGEPLEESCTSMAN